MWYNWIFHQPQLVSDHGHERGNMDRLAYAKFYAAKKHAGQDYGVLPYTHHLQEVEVVLREFGPTDTATLKYSEECPSWEDMFVAAWLHDVVEDTNAKLRDIEELFGETVARLVGAVTAEVAPNRKMRTALTYPKTREAGRFAVRLKLADRIANVSNGGGSVKMYITEYPDFRRALYTPGENEDMWSHLDKIMDGVK